MSIPGNDDTTFWAPGTVLLEEMSGSRAELILHPIPTSDPDDPLNWSPARKALNYGLVCFFVLWTFVQLDVGFTAWGPYMEELGLTINELNNGAALNYSGLALGCIFFIPFVAKYGRRPLYLFSSAVQLASVVWLAKTNTASDLLGASILSGLGGAISETVVQITIVDVFFVHQHGTMNGWYLAATCAGAFLGPAAAGFVVESQGWRWIWWWCTIFLALNLALVLFFFEESKFIPVVNGFSIASVTDAPSTSLTEGMKGDNKPDQQTKNTTGGAKDELVRTRSTIDSAIPRKTYRQRLALYTLSKDSMTHHFYQPIVVLFSFPAVGYCALTYGMSLSSFAIMTSVQATYLLEPPYNFRATGIGLINLAPFVGACFGFFVGGYLNDKSIMWLSKRNRGIYEPEMRLWLALAATPLLPAGILIFGLSLVRGVHWAALAVGYGLFGFGLVVASDIALSYVTDCYQEIVGDALVGIVFMRNLFSVVVLLTLTPWIEGMGVQNVHIVTAVVVFATLLLPIPLLRWGKRARIATAQRYKRMARRQPAYRTLEEH